MRRGWRRLAIGLGGLVGLTALGLGLGVWLNPPVAEVPRTVADDPALPRVELGGVLLHAEAHGDPEAPVVVVIHGGPGGDYRNLLVLKALADDYRVVFYDQRGTGLSARVPDGELTFESSLDDLDRVVRHYGGGEPVRLVGHSWGGMLAAYYASRHPERVARVAMAEPGVLTTRELQDFVADMQPSLDLALLGHVGAAWLETLRVWGPDDHAAQDYFIGRVMQAPGDQNPMNRYWCHGQAPAAAHEVWRVGAAAQQAVLSSATQPDGTLALPPLDAERYDRPALFIASACNAWIGEARQREHAAMFPRGRVVVIEDAGHLMFTDQPEQSLAVLREYLAAPPAEAPAAPTPEAPAAPAPDVDGRRHLPILHHAGG